jgi:hypothetical protein
MAPTVEERLKHIAKELHETILRPHGFKKQAYNFKRKLESLSWMLNFQKSRWNTKDKCEFTVNCGIYIPGVRSFLDENWQDPKNPSTYDSLFHARLPQLAGEEDKWWTVRAKLFSSSTDKKVLLDIVERIRRDALPFFESLRTLEDVISFMRDTPEKFSRVWVAAEEGRLQFCAILLRLSGRKDESLAAAREAARLVAGTRSEESFTAMLRRLEQ